MLLTCLANSKMLGRLSLATAFQKMHQSNLFLQSQLSEHFSLGYNVELHVMTDPKLFNARSGSKVYASI